MVPFLVTLVFASLMAAGCDDESGERVPSRSAPERSVAAPVSWQDPLKIEPLPTVEELVRSARARYAKKPLQFRADYKTEVRLATGEVKASEIYTSTTGRFEVRGPRDFRIANDVRYGPFRNVFLTQVVDRIVVTRLQRYDVDGEEPHLIDTLYRTVDVEDLERVSAVKLVGYVTCFVPDPARFLEVAAKRYPGLVVTALNEREVVLEALLTPEAVPPVERAAKPHKVRILLGAKDHVVREIAVLFDDGGIYTRHTLSNVTLEPVEEPFEKLVIPDGAQVQQLSHK